MLEVQHLHFVRATLGQAIAEANAAEEAQAEETVGAEDATPWEVRSKHLVHLTDPTKSRTTAHFQ